MLALNMAKMPRAGTVMMCSDGKLQKLLTPFKKMITDKHNLRVSVPGICIYLCFDFIE